MKEVKITRAKKGGFIVSRNWVEDVEIAMTVDDLIQIIKFIYED